MNLRDTYLLTISLVVAFCLPTKAQQDIAGARAVTAGNITIDGAPEITALSTHGFTMGWSTDVAGSTEARVGLSPALELDPVKLPGLATDHAVVIDGLNPAEFYYIQPFSVHEGDTARAAPQTVITVSESGGTFRALFNREVDPSVSLGLHEAEYLPGGLDDELIAYLDQAEESIEMAIYNLNNTGVSDISAALNRAHLRGVVVRVVYDGGVNAAGMQTLHTGIGKLASPYPDYPVYGLMHNKFVIIDAQSADPLKPVVWTGSTNLTDNQINMDPNNVVVVQDQSLARAYQLEFNEMFGSSEAQPDPLKARFGPDKTDNTPHQFLIGGLRVECYFSPSDGTHQQILQTILGSDHSIQVATMLITKSDLGDALISKNEAGRQVQVLINDYDQYGEPILEALKTSLGQAVRLNGEAGIMHHKYMIVDQASADSDPLVMTGSHNWSASAQLRNDENTLVIHDQGLANAYYQEFVRRFEAGEILVSDGDSHPAGRPSPVRVYPNPATRWIGIMTEPGVEIRSLDIYDASGREISRYLKPVPSRIPLDSFRRGLYVLKIAPEGTTPVYRRIIVH